MIYLDNAATSFPKPPQVVKAMVNQLEQIGGNAGRSSHQGGLASSRLLYETRCRIGELTNASDPLQIVFTLNATEALNLAIHGALKAGDHVVTTSMEHNSVLRPLKTLEKKGITHTIVWADKNGHVTPDAMEQAILPNTRMMIATHCSNVTGTVLPVEAMGKIAQQHQLLFLVDASQSCGSIPLNVETLQADFLAAPGHKALLGPQGTGFLYIGKEIKIEPLKQGGTGSRSEDLLQPEVAPDRYESGTQNIHGLAGLKAGIEYLLQTGVAAIQHHEEVQVKRLLEGLSVIKGITLVGPPMEEARGSVVSFTPGKLDVNQVSYTLDTLYGISSRSGLHCAPLAHQTIGTFPEGTLRLSPGWCTTSEEIETALQAISQIMSQFS